MSSPTTTIDWGQLHLLAEGDWTFHTEPPNSVEVVIEGDGNGPPPDTKALCTRITNDLPKYLAEAKEYLRTFISAPHFESKGDWSVDGLRFCDGDRTFVVELSLEDDVYGYWTVTFRNQPAELRAWPYQFARRQS